VEPAVNRARKLMAMFKINIKDKIFLTGAGFTKNFGGFLADEMWSVLFNLPRIQNSGLLRSRLLEDRNFDYESVYSNIMGDPDIPEDKRKEFAEAIYEAYFALDDAVVRGVPGEPDNYKVQEMIGWFGGNSSSRAIIFTLNQDLWLERQLGCNCPGVPPFPEGFVASGHKQIVDRRAFLDIDEQDVERRAVAHVNERPNFLYVKLHGSYGWRTREKPDRLVIGKFKEDTIKASALLKWYFEVFNWAIQRPNQKLLVIGYGFNDKHINDVLKKGIANSGLRLFVVDPRSPREFRWHLENQGAVEILKGLGGYFPYTLRSICSSPEETVQFRVLRSIFYK
jgi:hypothetical protein